MLHSRLSMEAGVAQKQTERWTRDRKVTGSSLSGGSSDVRIFVFGVGFLYWLLFRYSLKQNEAQSTRAESTHKGVN